MVCLDLPHFNCQLLEWEPTSEWTIHLWGERYTLRVPWCQIGGNGAAHLVHPVEMWLGLWIVHDATVLDVRWGWTKGQWSQITQFFAAYAVFQSYWGAGRRYALLADLMRVPALRGKVRCAGCKRAFHRWPEDKRVRYVTREPEDFFNPMFSDAVCCGLACRIAVEEKRVQVLAREAQREAQEAKKRPRELLYQARRLARDPEAREAARAMIRPVQLALTEIV